MDNVEWLEGLTQSAYSAPNVIVQIQSCADELTALRALVDEVIQLGWSDDWQKRAKELRK